MATTASLTTATYVFKAGQKTNAAGPMTAAGTIRGKKNRLKHYNVGDFLVKEPNGEWTVWDATTFNVRYVAG